MTDYQKTLHKQPADKEKKVEKVISGKATVKKKNATSKLADVFAPGDVKDVKSYVLMDVIVPAVKDTIADIVKNGIDMILFGSTGVSTGRRTNASKISYRNFYDQKNNRSHSHSISNRTNSVFDIDNIYLETKGEAEEVLMRMDELLEQYGLVSVADLYELVGVTAAPYTANKYGWTSLRTAEAIRTRQGYLLKLPRAVPID